MNDINKTAGQNLSGAHGIDTSAAAVLAALGFACLTAWGTCLVYAPALPLLSYLPLDQSIACLLVSCAAGIAVLGIGARLSHTIMRYAKQLILPGMLIAYVPLLAVGIVSWIAPGAAPAPLVFIAWLLGGVGWMIPSAQWMIVYTLMPTKWSALSIAGGGIIATPLFLLVGSAGVPAVGVAGSALLVFASGGIALFLLSRIDEQSLAAIEKCKPEHRKPFKTLKASCSVAAHGMSYGFIVIMILSLGLNAILIAGTTGIASALLAFLWARRRSKSSWTAESAQRFAVPLVVAVLLLIPFCNDAGRIVCGSISIATFAYVTLMEWTGQVVKNAEFQLFPLQRFAIGRLAQWFGFLIGALISYIMFFHASLSPVPLSLVVAVMAIVTVAAFAIYDNARDEEDTQLADIVLGDPSTLVIDPPKNAAPFRERCDALIEKFQLSSREAEVFRYLAKGRNAEYIQQKLYISANTVKTHISHIYKKMGVNNQQWLIDLVDQHDKRRGDGQDDGTRAD